MGNHLLDSTAPEQQNPPKTFTHTFIYGANGGSIIFLEPMITRASLLDRPDLCIPLKLLAPRIVNLVQSLGGDASDA